MFKAGEAARRNARPIILDPVGRALRHFGRRTARKLLAELQPAIVRGNASEIRALADDERSTRGSTAHTRRKMRPRPRTRCPRGTAAVVATSARWPDFVRRHDDSRLQRTPAHAEGDGAGMHGKRARGRIRGGESIGARGGR